MKKAKIMLTAITVLAIVGGALAFKARTFSVKYCTAAIAANVTACPNKFGTSTGVAHVNTITGAAFYYTITADATQCDNFNGVPGTPVPCSTSTKLVTGE